MPEIKDKIAAAAYIETLKSMEQTWITNRLSWLFSSQAFCIVAYVSLIHAPIAEAFGRKADYLVVALPTFGVLSSLFVGIAVISATRVSNLLVNERAKVTEEINKALGLNIPRIGHGKDHRDERIRLTEFLGLLPLSLPWALLVLWLLLFFNLNIDLHLSLTPR